MARLRIRETESPTWASSQAKGKLGKNTKVLQGINRCRLKNKFRQQWTIVSLLSILIYSQCIQRVPYIVFNGAMKGRIRAISRNMEGQDTSESDPCQGKLQNDLDYSHIPMYAVIGVKPAYVHGYRGKSRVYQYCNFFWG